MRITQSMISNNFMNNLNSINQQMEKTQYQLGSGQLYRLPEDGPTETVKAMVYSSTLTQVNKYIDNIREARIWLDNSDAALNEVNNVMQRINELFVEANTDTLGIKERQAIAKEINELTQHISSVANTSVAGRSIFAGTKTEVTPSQQDPVTGEWRWLGNSNPINVEFDANVTVQINTIGQKLFATPVGASGKDLMNFLQDMTAKLEKGERVAGNTELGQFMDVLLQERAAIGGRVNRVDFTENRLQDFEISVKDLLSKTANADMAEVYTQMSMQQNIYRAALSAGSKIIQPSLVDFLR
ncbi:flagellar hook-associated protein FlgL [Heliophilum fasciatum]|uniref:flagellar hook-associated protein FlgL n=1 Tax=Heliophilum fasciatum TaxID=35700 RepID=UPI001047562B|nr:flagellar hook-associated protein FlgL [Heliophilum fasciatum]MCW2278820.1 flagellar hook-associated protein 3 FlgL [Heliophilum fasciatum]